ncbi:MAG: ABC-2 transporter permease [Lachnospiraceae bacterium]
MKGLLLKDIYIIQHNSKQMIFLMLFLALTMIPTLGGYGYISLCCVMCCMMTITTFSMDERASWMKYAFIMPISPRVYVLGKYIINLIFTLIGTIFGMIICCIYQLAIHHFDLNNYLLNGFTGLVVGIVFGSLYIPILFRFGSEHARFIIIAVAVIPIAIIFIIAKLCSYFDITITPNMLPFLMCIGIIGLLLIIVGPYFYCLHCLSKKEF